MRLCEFPEGILAVIMSALSKRIVEDRRSIFYDKDRFDTAQDAIIKGLSGLSFLERLMLLFYNVDLNLNADREKTTAILDDCAVLLEEIRSAESKGANVRSN